MKRDNIYKDQLELCKAVEIYPAKLTVRDLSVKTGYSPEKIEGMVIRMSTRCLLSEETVKNKRYYFFAYPEDKKKTLKYIESRIYDVEIYHTKIGNRRKEIGID